MTFCRLLPRVLAVCLALNVFAAAANAQTETRSRQVVTISQIDGSTRLETDPVIVSLAPVDNTSTSTPFDSISRPTHLKEMMLAAIDMRLGTPYLLGATGPYRFDCSGFVWSVFQSAGVNFERSNARTLWDQFAPARDNEKFQFGTLVFFNNLKHVGIVADGNGFYHASTSQGVMYSPFNDYWSARIDGHRRVPTPELEAVASLK